MQGLGESTPPATPTLEPQTRPTSDFTWFGFDLDEMVPSLRVSAIGFILANVPGADAEADWMNTHYMYGSYVQHVKPAVHARPVWAAMFCALVVFAMLVYIAFPGHPARKHLPATGKVGDFAARYNSEMECNRLENNAVAHGLTPAEWAGAATVRKQMTVSRSVACLYTILACRAEFVDGVSTRAERALAWRISAGIMDDRSKRADVLKHVRNADVAGVMKTAIKCMEIATYEDLALARVETTRASVQQA